MSYELNRHKKSDAIKWIVVFVLILALIAGMLAVFTGGYKNWDVKTWFGGGDDTEQTDPNKKKDDPTVVDDNGNEMNSNQVYAMPTHMVYASARAATTPKIVMLNANITPENATNKSVTWAVKFKDNNSAWANGKTVTDYVSIQDTDTLTNTVTFKQSFGEQVIISVTSVSNKKISASCTIDCAQKVVDNNVIFDAGAGLEDDFALDEENDDIYNQETGYIPLKIYADATQENIKQAHTSYTASSDPYTLTDEFNTVVRFRLGKDATNLALQYYANGQLDMKINILDPYALYYDATSGIIPNIDIFTILLGAENDKEVLYPFIAELADNLAPMFDVEVVTTGKYSEFKSHWNGLEVSPDDFGIGVDEISINNDTIVF